MARQVAGPFKKQTHRYHETCRKRLVEVPPRQPFLLAVFLLSMQQEAKVPEFYQAFSVNPGQPMWRSPETRVMVW